MKKYAVWFFRLIMIGAAVYVALSLTKYFEAKNQKPISSLTSPAIQHAAFPGQESPESVFEAFRKALASNDVKKIEQLTHPRVWASVGRGEGLRPHDLDTLKVQLADAEIRSLKYQSAEGVESAEAIVFLYRSNRSSPPREGKLRFIKMNGSWYWAER